MQFIFASDRDNGYGILYTDGRSSEAGQIRDKINIQQIGIDSFGFLSFGVNSNQPLFFRVNTDTSYPRGAYYIHGIYRKGDPDYFSSGKYEDDILASFVTQDKLDALRSEEKVIPADPSVDAELARKARGSDVDKNVLCEIVSRIYNEEKVLISVSDHDYSNDYARCLIAEIFRYLTPSLRKSCTYITGISDASSMPDIRMRIVPAANVAEGCINVSSPSKSSSEFDFHSIAERIISMSEGERNDVFSWYERLLNGYGSYYLAKKFVDFWEAYNGNAELAEKLLDSFLRSCEDPDISLIPPFVAKMMTEKYALDSIGRKDLFNVSSVEDIIDPERVLAANTVLIKKLSLFCINEKKNVADIYICFVFLRKFSLMSLTDDDFRSVSQAINSFDVSKMQSGEKYREYFYRGIAGHYHEIRPRVDSYFAARSKVIGKIGEVFGFNKSRLLVTSHINHMRNEIETLCVSQSLDAKDADTLKSVALAEFDSQLAAHDRHCYDIFGDDVRNVDLDNEAEQNFNNLYKKLTSGDLIGVPELMALVYAQFGPYRHLVDVQAADYAIRVSNSLLYGNDPLFIRLSEDPQCILDIASRTVSKDPNTAVNLIAAYGHRTQFVSDLYNFIRFNGHFFDTLEAEYINQCAANLSLKINERLSELTDEERRLVVIENDTQETERNSSSRTNTSILADAVKETVVKKGKKASKEKKKEKSSFNVIPLICAVFALLAIALVVVILYVGGFVFGGSKDSGTDSGAGVSGQTTEDSATQDSSDLTNGDPEQSEPETVVTEPTETSEITDPDEVTTDPEEITTEPDEITTEPEEITTEPDEITTDPEEITTDPDGEIADEADADAETPDPDEEMTTADDEATDPGEDLSGSEEGENGDAE